MDKGSAALTGAGTGAAAGTAIMPGIGTAAGALIGGIGGWLLGDSGDDAPAYNPDRSNFEYGLGQYVDAQGVLHPTPEEMAQAEAHWEAERQRIGQLKIQAEATMKDPAATPEQKEQAWRDFSSIEGQFDEIDAAYNAVNQARNRGVDTYAAQRTRETIGRQGALADVAVGSLGREAPQQAMVANEGQNYLRRADGASKQQQLEALGGLKAFANREQGPSAAQAQLQAGTDMAARQQYGMARSQVGGGGAALRNASFNAAGISGNAANSAAMLRAQEDQAFRQQQLAALGAVSNQTGQMRAGDQSLAQMQANQANQAAGQRLQVGQNNLNAQLQNRQQNDAMFLGTNQQIMGYDAMRDQLARGQQSAGTSYEGAKAQGAGLGSQNYNAAQQQSNTELAMGLGAASSGLATYAASQQAANAGGNPAAQAAGQGGWNASKGAGMTSDVRAKEDIEKVDVLKALGAAPQQAQAPSQGSFPDAPDLRPAQGYEYSYKNPQADGAGRFVGPMAQNLEHLPGVVQEGEGGKKQIDASRLTLANTAAVSEQQRRMDEIERRQRLQALSGGLQMPAFPAPVVRPPDYAALDQAQR